MYDITYSRRNVGKMWTKAEEKRLANLVENQTDVNDICEKMGRNIGGILVRINKLLGENKLTPQYAYYITKLNAYISLEDYKQNTQPVRQEQNMNKSGKTWTMVSMLQEDIITLKVTFDGVRDYTYKTRDKSITTDDYVVVNPGAEEGRFSIGRVMSIDEQPDFNPDSGLRYYWIVSKVDAADYNELVASDERAYELLKNAEKHVARKKLLDMYKEALELPSADELRKLLKGESND